MKPRRIPLQPYSDEVRPFDFNLIYGLMHYPRDLCTAIDYATSVYRWEGCRAENPKAEEPRSLQLFANDMKARRGRASMSGLVLFEYAVLRTNGGKPSIRKAAHIASQLAARQPSEGKRRADYPSDEGDIQKYYREFRPVAHLWLAFCRCGSAPYVLRSSPEQYEEFIRVSHLAATELLLTKPRSDKGNGEPFFWEPPLVNLAGELIFRLDDSSALLENYRVLEERDQGGGE